MFGDNTDKILEWDGHTWSAVLNSRCYKLDLTSNYKKVLLEECKLILTCFTETILPCAYITEDVTLLCEKHPIVPQDQFSVNNESCSRSEHDLIFNFNFW